MEIVLPVSGAKATLRERLKNKERRAILQGAETNAPEGASPLDQAWRVSDLMVAFFVESWTLTDETGEPLPLPSVDLGVLDEIDAADYDALIEAAGNARKSAFPAVSEVSPDPSSPIEPSDV